ncbi:hypothetical protein [Microbispora rosea]|uniref:hypothetical protein n=1 Tax=Microbispora rosea TaxID=58117 RepID=UPI00194DB456|nr:hypothetical protein [Microbispora rosea]
MPITDEELALTAAQAGAAVVRAMWGTSLTRVAKSPDDFRRHGGGLRRPLRR